MAKLRSVNPATGKVLGEAKIATKAEIEVVVNRAKKAFPGWQKVNLGRRSRMLLRLADLLDRQTKRLAGLITQEMGKPLKESIDEVKGSVEFISYVAEEGMRRYKDEVLEPEINQNLRNQLRRQESRDALKLLINKVKDNISLMRYDPIGVVACIKPWNYPIEVSMWALAPALMAGNCVVFKPSEEVPLVSQELAKLIWQAGVPKEVFQIIQGRSQVGAMLVESEIDMVSFTGSSAVGKEIADKVGKRLIKMVLELGGNSAALVLKDADLEMAVNGIISGRFQNCGQMCSAIKRVLVEQEVAEKFINHLAEQMQKLRVGNPLDKEVEIGPLVSEKQLKKLQGQVTKGVIQGGRIIVGGRRLYDEPYNKGWFHEPTLMIHVQPRNYVMQEEVFGPVLAVCEVSGLNQAINYANQTRYGLTTAVFTNSKLKADRVIKEVETGAVFVNEVCRIPVNAPWTGLKDSGYGTGLSKHGLWEFVHKKHIWLDQSGTKTRAGWFKQK